MSGGIDPALARLEAGVHGIRMVRIERRRRRTHTTTFELPAIRPCQVDLLSYESHGVSGPELSGRCLMQSSTPFFEHHPRGVATAVAGADRACPNCGLARMAG